MFDMGHGWGMGFGMWLLPAVLIVVVILLLKDTNKEKPPSAQDILDRRFANGEIDLEEYQERSNALKKQ